MNGSWALIALAFACDGSRTITPAEEVGTPSARADALAVLAVAPGGSATSATRAADAWHGSYKSTAGALYVPADWKNVRWVVKESNAGVGEGPIALTVDRTSGRVLGTLEGPLGPATIDGFAADRKLTATIARRDPADKGFTGTLVGSIGDESVAGTINVSPAEAEAIRTATFTLSPDGTGALSR